jgi:hypothetical protein
MPTTSQRKQKMYDRAIAKPEAQRSWMDRNYIRQYGPQPSARAERANPSVLVREYQDYQDAHAMQQDIAKLLGEGWHIQSQSTATPKKGAIRVLADGPVFVNRKPVTTVVFSRPAAI